MEIRRLPVGQDVRGNLPDLTPAVIGIDGHQLAAACGPRTVKRNERQVLAQHDTRKPAAETPVLQQQPGRLVHGDAPAPLPTA